MIRIGFTGIGAGTAIGFIFLLDFGTSLMISGNGAVFASGNGTVLFSGTSCCLPAGLTAGGIVSTRSMPCTGPLRPNTGHILPMNTTTNKLVGIKTANLRISVKITGLCHFLRQHKPV
ncbi:hypothetical protein [Chitinophaga caseinilytica]|uniref:Uncharacterized protein n=1 Tax=Chitinophaga caseinilytica TaxID=2267521 RepID=A0ABZ2Z3I0_9BACT